MEIWLIRNGQKSGPYPDYEIRGRIEHGELEPDAKVWHDGLAEWTEIGQIDLFRKEFGRKAVEPSKLPKEYLERAGTGEKSAISKHPKAHVARRFWARWMDLSLYSSLWWLGMYFAGRDIGLAMQNPWILLPLYIPWFAIESWLLHRFRTTPGKWLMSLEVINEDKTELSLKSSVWRSMRVMVTGIGFGWNLLSILCQAMSWFTTKRIGKPVWDFLGAHIVTAKTLNPLKVAALVLAFVISGALHFSIQGRYIERVILETKPDMAEYYKSWHWIYLPEK